MVGATGLKTAVELVLDIVLFAAMKMKKNFASSHGTNTAGRILFTIFTLIVFYRAHKFVYIIYQKAKDIFAVHSIVVEAALIIENSIVAALQ